MSRTVLDERLSRALTAFLRQEVQAPATAVTDLLDMIIEDARSSQPESMLADLNRMRGASVQLNAFVKGLDRRICWPIIRKTNRSKPSIAVCVMTCARR